jgi:glycolate oxidase FAD binding subunit
MIDAVGGRSSFTVRNVAATPGLGSVFARLEAPDTITGPRLRELQTDLLGIADTVTILAAEPAAKRAVDVWGRTPDTIDVMRTLKAQFDPGNILNPGRFAGRI